MKLELLGLVGLLIPRKETVAPKKTIRMIEASDRGSLERHFMGKDNAGTLHVNLTKSALKVSVVEYDRHEYKSVILPDGKAPIRSISPHLNLDQYSIDSRVDNKIGSRRELLLSLPEDVISRFGIYYVGIRK